MTFGTEQLKDLKDSLNLNADRASFMDRFRGSLFMVVDGYMQDETLVLTLETITKKRYTVTFAPLSSAQLLKGDGNETNETD